MSARSHVTILLLLLLFGSATGLRAQVTADFTATGTSGCSPIIVSFSDQSSGNIISRQWIFGNGNNAQGNLTSVTAAYTTPGTYDVKLIVSDGTNTDSITKTGIVTVFDNPTADFTASPTSGCRPVTVAFQDLSTPANAPIAQWQWDFGDGSAPNTTASPTHTYGSAGSFTVSLVVTDANGCTGSDVAFNYIQSNAGPTAAFGAIGPTASCTAPLTVSFVNNSTGTGNLTYLWDFGDTTTSTAVSPTHTYSSLGIRTVTLYVTDLDGCSDSISIPAFVTIAPVDAQFSVPSVVCPGDPITFANNSVGASNFNWNFGDGTSSQAANPGKVYNTPGTYVVTLNASSGSCNDVFTDTITVDLVDADYTASPAYGCAIPHLVNYTDNSSGNIVQWDWSFANGTGSGQQNPLAVYNSPGTFFDTLVVTTANGCTDIVVKPVTVFLVNVDFDMDTTRGCAPLTINFTDLSSPQDSIAAWIWDFGDGDSSSLQNPSHTFLTDGIFTVTLSVVTVSGCTLNTSYDVRAGLHNVPNFTVNPSIGCAHDVFTFDNLSTDTNVIDSYIWQFGDGMTSTKFEPGHVYIDTGYMDVSLIVGHLGCYDTLVLDSLLYAQGPVVYFQPVVDCQTPLDVQFNSTLIDATSWQWDFGDGSPIDSTSANPLHTYPNQGAYTVKLTAQNANNGCDYDTLETVFLLPVLAEFTIDDADGCVPHTVNLNAFGSLNALHTEWDFGNGSPTVQDTFITSYTYTSAGTYPIRLVVEGGDGCRDTLIKNVVVSQPVADFSVPDTVGCAPFAVQFTDLSTADTTIVSWAWSLGNGSGSTAQNPSTVYPLIGNGVFTVSLRVTDINGCSDTLVRQNYISVQSTPIDFQATSPVCEGDTVFFSNVPGGPGSTYFWQFGDGQTDTAHLPAHVYQTLGFHNVTLTITDSIGCDTTLTKNSFVQIQPIPVAAFTANPRDSSCFPMAVTFTDTGGLQLIQQRIWDFGDGSAPITVLGPANNTVVHTYTAPGKYDVSLIKRTDAGCADTLLQPEYIEVGGPLATFTIDADTVCKGEPVTFTVTSQVNVLNFFWDFGDGQDTLVPATTTTVQHVYQQTGPLIPQLIFWDSAGVCPKFADTAILIDEVVAGFNLAGDTAGCVPFSLALTDLSVGASGWSWNFGNGSGSSLPTAQVTYAQAGNYQLLLVARDTITQCQDSVAVSVQAYATPVVTVSTDSFLCEGDTMPLLATGGVAYQWSPTNGLSDTAIPDPVAFPDSTQAYAVLVTDANGCTATGTTVVGVQPFPAFEGPLLNRDTTIFIGQTVELVTTASELLTYAWSPPSGLSCTTCPAPVAAPGEDVVYTVVAEDANGCFRIVRDITINVTDDFTVYIPNAFTPNGDGLNDRVGVKAWGIRRLVEFSIFNRWGEQVFETNDLSEGWDGTVDGRMTNTNVFAYRVIVERFTGQQLTYTGRITLVR